MCGWVGSSTSTGGITTAHFIERQRSTIVSTVTNKRHSTPRCLMIGRDLESAVPGFTSLNNVGRNIHTTLGLETSFGDVESNFSPAMSATDGPEASQNIRKVNAETSTELEHDHNQVFNLRARDKLRVSWTESRSAKRQQVVSGRSGERQRHSKFERGVDGQPATFNGTSQPLTSHKKSAKSKHCHEQAAQHAAMPRRPFLVLPSCSKMSAATFEQPGTRATTFGP